MRTEWFLLDSGVWIAAGSPGERFESAAQKVLADSGWDAAALDLTLYEVTNVIGARRGDVVGAAMVCRSIQVRCRESLIRVDVELIEATAELAVEHGLTSYDAAYVAVARRHDWTLVSTDVRDLVSKGLAITPDAAV
jgi:predicted nucleic acid-binding protein